MSIRKGVVLEIEGQDAVVLTDRGEFTRVPVRRRQLEVGMEITLPSRKSTTFQMRSFAGWVAAAAAIMLMVFSPFNLLANSAADEVVAYVDIDINPSISLAVNKDQDVVAAEPQNDDGIKVLSEINVRGKDMEKATALITEQAIKDGFIGPKASNAVMIALTPAQGEQISNSWETDLKLAVGNVLKEEHQVASVDTMIGSQELRMNARSKGLSVGKYAVLLAAKEKNLPITVAEVKQMSITELIKDKGVKAADLVKTKHTSKDWDRIAAKFDDKLDDGTVVALTEATDKTTGANGADASSGAKAGASVEEPKNPPGVATISSFNHSGAQNTSKAGEPDAAKPSTAKPSESSGTDSGDKPTVSDKVYAPKEDTTTDTSNSGAATQPGSPPDQTP